MHDCPAHNHRFAQGGSFDWKVAARPRAQLRGGPMALPEKRPPKSIDVQAMVQVLAVSVKVEGHFVGLIKLSTEGGVDDHGGLDASAVDGGRASKTMAKWKNERTVGWEEASCYQLRQSGLELPRKRRAGKGTDFTNADRLVTTPGAR
jgi:hypothetical protein